jgi:hypothetical protein
LGNQQGFVARGVRRRDKRLTEINRKEIIRVIYRVHDGYTTPDGEVVPPRPISANRTLGRHKTTF